MTDFLEVFQNLRSDNIQTIRTIYRKDIRFVDPAHEVTGVENLINYFRALYQNVESIHFSFSNPIWSESSGFIRWEMTFTHKKLRKGDSILVHGISFLEFDENNMVYYHRDYFDLGEMLYEHIPLLGTIIASVKRRLST